MCSETRSLVVKDHCNDFYYHGIFVIVDSAIARETTSRTVPLWEERDLGIYELEHEL